jgi:hypothetical protein
MTIGAFVRGEVRGLLRPLDPDLGLAECADCGSRWEPSKEGAGCRACAMGVALRAAAGEKV